MPVQFIGKKREATYDYRFIFPLTLRQGILTAFELENTKPNVACITLCRM